MDFGQIINRSWEITKKYRFLWWLGLLALATEAGGGVPTFYNFNTPLTTIAPTATPSAVVAPPPVPPAPEGVIATTTPSQAGSATATATAEATSASSNSTGTVAALTITFIILLAIVIAIYYISYCAKAGLIIAADRLEPKEAAPKLTFGKLFHDGRKYGWRLFWFNVMVGLITLAFVVILLTPAVMVIITSQQAAALIVTIGMFIISFLLFIVYEIVISVVKRLGERAVVLDEKPAFQALGEGLQTAGHRPGNTALTYLISIVLGLAFGVIALIVFFILGAILVGLGLIIYMLLLQTGAIIYTIIAGLGLIILFFALLSIYTAFISTFWTLSFKQLAKR